MSETDPSTFWWNWLVQLATAIGTIGAVLVALFGQAFRARFFPPKLSLRLNSADGELTTRVQDGRSERVRYYHLRVSNTRRWSPAHGVHIALLQLEQPGPNGALQVIWQGDIPLGWRHQSLFPLARTIGPDANADLCSVSEGRRLRLHPLIAPFNLDLERTGPSQLALTLQARGDEVDSPALRIRVAWDGNWNAGAKEMRRHLAVEELAA